MAEREITFLTEVDRLSGQQVELCYHCHTCSAGCPVNVDMEFGPDRVIRLIELGERARVLATRDIWLCATCETCSVRCPNAIDVAGVMDTLRHISVEAGWRSSQPRVLAFHRSYLGVVRALGRSHEAVMLGLYKLVSRDLLSDLNAGAVMILKGKIPLLPKRIKGTPGVDKVFQMAAEADREQAQAAVRGAGGKGWQGAGVR